jgi:hypothetical protein
MHPGTEEAVKRLLPTTLAMADVAYDVLLETDLNIALLPI